MSSQKNSLLKLFLLFMAGFPLVHSEPIAVPTDLGSPDCTRLFFKDRPGDYPLPTEITFRHFSEHEITCTIGSFDPDKVGLGDTVYVQDWYLRWFWKNIHPKIKHPYILISCDTDDYHPCTWTEERAVMYDPKVAAWFCKNIVLDNHPKLFALPYGQGIVQHYYTKEDIEFYLALCKKPASHKLLYPLVYMNFNPINHPVRDYVKPLFANESFCYAPRNFVDRRIYHEDLARHKFTLAPRGQAIDTTRFWEAIGLGTIPIIEHSPLDALYEGTPSLCVKNWEDITEEFLLKKYEEIQKKLQMGILSKEKAFFPYWRDKIRQVQNLIRSGEWRQNELEAAKFSDSALEQIKSLLLRNQDSWKWKKCILLVHGQLLGLRALQLSTALPQFDKIFFADDYAYSDLELSDPPYNAKPRHAKMLLTFAKEPYYFDGRLEFVSEETFPITIKRYQMTVAVFMDLTHYRYNFTEKLLQFYHYLPDRAIICGNQANAPYVRDLLHDFSIQKRVQIQQEGDLWYFLR